MILTVFLVFYQSIAVECRRPCVVEGCTLVRGRAVEFGREVGWSERQLGMQRKSRFWRAGRRDVDGISRADDSFGWIAKVGWTCEVEKRRKSKRQWPRNGGWTGACNGRILQASAGRRSDKDKTRTVPEAGTSQKGQGRQAKGEMQQEPGTKANANVSFVR